ncbi:hypothetical protein V5O48_006231 [Marasmius crinis-equi]|uniref:DASH complex subunit DUO1 n=1 Tax=Marasmius crinis-equi TaxID=585013 RepID=A0ABR3FKG7_9AGAR
MQQGDFSDDIRIPSSSRLMSESPMLPSGSSASYDDGDLSISDLSISDRTAMQNKPFSLLAQPLVQTQDTEESRADNGDENENENGQPTTPGEGEADEEQRRVDAQRLTARQREEKLQRDIVVLKKLNSAFTAFNNALDDVGSANNRIAEQLSNTEVLLDKYMKILAKSEEFSRLIFDEEFEGGEADENFIERERTEAVERERKEAERRALEAERERERKAREEQERLEREQRERAERERATASRGTIRGVRGTRASMRGVRGTSATSRGGTGVTRGGTPPTTASGQRSTSAAGRASAITRGTTRRT